MKARSVAVAIRRPSEKEVERYLHRWESLENYVVQERSLRKLFERTYPLNERLEDVLIKVCALNDLYSTNIYSSVKVALRIVSLRIDRKLGMNDYSVVNEMADVTVGTNKRKNFYSFATKYCSHHKPTVFPIYDSYVAKMLRYFGKTDGFDRFVSSDLRDYPKFRRILIHFRKHYGLGAFNWKEIDRYLWQAGKDYFPKPSSP